MPRARSVWDELPTGRLDERGHDETELFGGRHAGIRRTMAWALRTRANWILRGFGGKPHTAPVIIKQVSDARSQEALRRVARYIARLGFEYPKPAERPVALPAEPLPTARVRPLLSRVTDRAARNETHEPVVYDQDGNRIPRDRVLETLAQWGLLADRENLTETGLEALRSGGPKGLDAVPEADAFAEVQGRHIVVSVPMLDVRKKPIFEQIVRQFVKETFGAWDYPALVAVHVEHGREIHGHILVGTSNMRTRDIESIGGRTLKNADHERFFFDYDGIIADGLRLTLADVAQRFGMDVDASRREDRMELVFEILRGKEELRPLPAKKQRGREAGPSGIDELPPILRRLVQQVPLVTQRVADDLVENYVVDKTRRAELVRLPEPIDPPPAKKKTLLDRALDWIPGRRQRSKDADELETAVGRLLKPLYDRAKLSRPFVEGPDRDSLHDALVTWAFMSLENRSYGRWVLFNAPFLLGPVTSKARTLMADEAFVELVDSVDFGELEPLIERDPGRLGSKERHTSSENAIAALRAALRQQGEVSWETKLAIEGQKGIVRSYRRLAETMESAFAGSGPDREDADKLRDIADLIAAFEILPVRASDVAKLRDALGLPAGSASPSERNAGKSDTGQARSTQSKPNRNAGFERD